MEYGKNQVSFHDSSLVKVATENQCLRLYFEDVTYNDVQCSATVTICNIEHFTRDAIQMAGFRMETDDGEVLRLSIDDNIVTLVVIWHTHAPDTETTHIYQMSGKTIRLDIEQT